MAGAAGGGHGAAATKAATGSPNESRERERTRGKGGSVGAIGSGVTDRTVRSDLTAPVLTVGPYVRFLLLKRNDPNLILEIGLKIIENSININKNTLRLRKIQSII